MSPIGHNKGGIILFPFFPERSAWSARGGVLGNILKEKGHAKFLAVLGNHGDRRVTDPFLGPVDGGLGFETGHGLGSGGGLFKGFN
jgi:hypothetical protein